jgi:hypothetical protein
LQPYLIQILRRQRPLYKQKGNNMEGKVYNFFVEIPVSFQFEVIQLLMANHTMIIQCLIIQIFVYLFRFWFDYSDFCLIIQIFVHLFRFVFNYSDFYLIIQIFI